MGHTIRGNLKDTPSAGEYCPGGHFLQGDIPAGGTIREGENPRRAISARGISTEDTIRGGTMRGGGIFGGTIREEDYPRWGTSAEGLGYFPL